jgi:hypothetical protein
MQRKQERGIEKIKDHNDILTAHRIRTVTVHRTILKNMGIKTISFGVYIYPVKLIAIEIEIQSEMPSRHLLVLLADGFEKRPPERAGTQIFRKKLI